MLTLLGYLIAYGAVDSFHQLYHAQVDHQPAGHFAIQPSAEDGLSTPTHNFECQFLTHLRGLSNAPALATASLQLVNTPAPARSDGMKTAPLHLLKPVSLYVPRGPPPHLLS